MKLTKCPEGHSYDSEKFASCPVCSRVKDGPRKSKVVKVKAVRRSTPSALAPEKPVEKKPEQKAAPVAEKPVEKKPEQKAAPVAEKPIEKKPEQKAAPVAEKPVEKKPEQKAAPVAEKPIEKKPEQKAAPVAEKPVEKKPEQKQSGYNKQVMTIEDAPIKKPVKKPRYDGETIYDADFRPVEEHYKPNEVKADDIKQALAKNKPQKPAEAKPEPKKEETKKEPVKAEPAAPVQQNKPKVNISQFAREAATKPVKTEIKPEAATEHDVGGVKITYSEFKPGQTHAPTARDLKTSTPKTAPEKETKADEKKPTSVHGAEPKVMAVPGKDSDPLSAKPVKGEVRSSPVNDRIAELYKDEDIERDETARIDDVNNMALGKDGTLLIKYIGTNEVIKIPSNITTIGKYAFRGNESAKKIIMSDSVKVVDKFAFAHCVHLEEIVFSKNLESIGENAFLKCMRLKELDLPNSLKTIGKGAFGRCSSIRKLVFPSGIKKISDLSFYSCRNLNRVIVSGNIESIGNAAFSECYGLKKILISDSVTSIGESAFSWCRSLEEITIPPSVKSIGSWAFYGCQNLTDVKLSLMTKDIRDDAFSGCENIYEVHINEFDNSNISLNDTKKGHKQVIKILKQVNRKKAERYANEHGISTLFL